MEEARFAQEEAELHTISVLGTPLEIKDIKMLAKFKSLKPLRRIGERVSHYHGEYCSESSTNFALHLYIREFSQKVTVNITKGKSKKVQIQGLKNMDDMELVMSRFGCYGLHVIGKPQLSSIICSTPIPFAHDMNFPHEFVVGNHALKNGHAKLYFKANGTMMMTGRSWDHIMTWVNGFAGHVIGGNMFGIEDPLLFEGPLGLFG